jgi:hypothetical protein
MVFNCSQDSYFVGDWAMAKILGVLAAALVAWGSVAQAERTRCLRMQGAKARK